jgi:hypothetical protein
VLALLLGENMEERDARLLEGYKNNRELFFSVGLLASDWAMIEFMINDCIWKLGEMHLVVGEVAPVV